MPSQNDFGIYTELVNYDDNQWDMVREPDDVPGNELLRYEITFEVNGERYYCFADAASMDEALGQFFRSHPHVTYEMVIEHFEV